MKGNKKIKIRITVAHKYDSANPVFSFNFSIPLVSINNLRLPKFDLGLGRQVFAFFSILALVFSPFADFITPYLPEKIAEKVETKKAQAVNINDQIILFYNPASASSDLGSGMPSGGGNLGTDWECISCSGQAYDNYFLVGSSSFGTGGAKTHSAQGTLTHSTPSNTDDTDAAANTISANSHTHTLSVTDSNPSDYPKYGRLMMIKYVGALPMTSLPDNVVAMFDASPPSGWTTLTTWNDRIIIASNSSDPANAGADTHSHTLTWGALGAATGTTTEANSTTALADTNHTHTAPSAGATNTLSNVPVHASLIFATTNGTVSDFENVIAMFDATPDSNFWSVISDTGDPLVNDFIEASTSYNAAAPVGANTHTHGNVTSGNSGTASDTNSNTASTANNIAAIAAHTHTITLTSSASTNRPPYKGIIFAKGLPDPTVTQRAYVFQNDDAVNGNPNSNSNAEAVNTALSDVKIGQRFITRFQVDGILTNQNLRVQYDKNDSNWRELGVASAAFYPAPILSFNSVATRSLTSSQTGSCNGSDTYTSGEIISNSIYANTVNITATQCTDFAFGIRTASVSQNTTYRFRLFNWAASTSLAFSQYPTVTTVTSANDTIRYSKFLVGPPVTASKSQGFMTASKSYSFSMPLDQLGYSSVSTDNSKFDVFASQSGYMAGGVASTSNLFFEDAAGLMKIASNSINAIGWNGTYWLIGEDSAKLVRIFESRDSLLYTNVSANLSGWSATAEIKTIYWNGTYWLIGGGDNGAIELNRCNSNLTSCTDVTGTLSGFGTNKINSIHWNGQHWLIGGDRGASTEGLNICNSGVTSCTNVASNLQDWTSTDDVLTVHWGNGQWFVGGQNAQANTCVGAVTSCTDVDTNLSGFGTDSVLSAHWNGVYWVVTGQNSDINRCTAGISCTDVSANLVSWGASNHASASYWNGTYWLLGGAGQELNRCNLELTSCTDVSGNLFDYNTSGVEAIYWNGTSWFAGGDTGRLNRCSLDAAACEDLYGVGHKGFNVFGIRGVHWDGRYMVIGADFAKLDRCNRDLTSCVDLSSSLVNFGSELIYGVYGNGTNWVIGGTAGALNICNSEMTSCTDVTARKSAGFGAATNVRGVYWNGTNWFVAGDSRGLDRCDSTISTTCTDVSANLVAFGATENIYDIRWNGTMWMIAGGASSLVDRCDTSDISATCTQVDTNFVNLSAAIRSLYWNEDHWLFGGTGGQINLCNYNATVCQDVAANLNGWAAADIFAIHTSRSIDYWMIGGGTPPKLNVCNKAVTRCINVTSQISGRGGYSSTTYVYELQYARSSWVMAGGVSFTEVAIARAYERFPAYYLAAKNDNNTDDITAEVNLKSSMPAASKSFTLQAYNWSTNQWVTQDTNDALASGTEGTLTGSITADNSQYYSASLGGTDQWTFWRFYQDSGFEDLKTDYINFTFTAAAVPPVDVGMAGGGTGSSFGGNSGGGTPVGGGGAGGGDQCPPEGCSGGGNGQGGGGPGGGGGGSPVMFDWSWFLGWLFN